MPNKRIARETTRVAESLKSARRFRPTICIVATPELLERIMAYARRQKVSKSQAVRKLIASGLDAAKR